MSAPFGQESERRRQADGSAKLAEYEAMLRRNDERLRRAIDRTIHVLIEDARKAYEANKPIGGVQEVTQLLELEVRPPEAIHLIDEVAKPYRDKYPHLIIDMDHSMDEWRNYKYAYRISVFVRR